MARSFSPDNYAAIIGDIVDSKKITDRKANQQKFKNVLVAVNENYAEDIASQFTITLGDEFQGLLKRKTNIMKIIGEIERAMAPVELRFGIGIGEISTDINWDYSTEIDGPAYHRARKMMQEMQNRKSQYTERQSTLMICSGESNQETDELLNSILSICTALKSKWTDRQKEIIAAYLANDENQYKAAHRLQIGQPSVNKALHGARFYSYRSAIETVSSFLCKEREAPHG